MSALPTPKPWSERAGDEAALLASQLATQSRPAPSAAPSIGSVLAPLAAKLGERTDVCEKHGEYQATGHRIRSREYWTGCPACSEELRQAEESTRLAREADARKARLEEQLQRTALPERFVGRTLDSYVVTTPEQRAALNHVKVFVDDFDRHLRRGTTLVLSGKPGTGKSHLAGAAIQAILPRHVGLYVTAMGLIRMVRETWRKDSARSEGQVLADLARVDLLVVDELGVQYGTDAEKTLLFEVLDRRYMDRKPSILLTNLGLEGFREYVGERVTDRLREIGTWIPFEWESYRVQARKEQRP